MTGRKAIERGAPAPSFQVILSPQFCANINMVFRDVLSYGAENIFRVNILNNQNGYARGKAKHVDVRRKPVRRFRRRPQLRRRRRNAHQARAGNPRSSPSEKHAFFRTVRRPGWRAGPSKTLENGFPNADWRGARGNQVHVAPPHRRREAVPVGRLLLRRICWTFIRVSA